MLRQRRSTATSTTDVSPRRPSLLRHLALTGLRLLFVGWLVATVTFVGVRALPGNPVDLYVQELVSGGTPIAEARAQAARAVSLDLDSPLPVQYVQFVANLARGDLGESTVLAPGSDVLVMILERLPWTLFSVGGALALSFAIGLYLGTAAAFRRGRWLDHALTNTSAAVDSIPAVLLAVFAVFYLGVVTEWVPLSSMRGAYGSGVTPGWNLPFILSALQHAAVPGLVYVLSSLGGWVLAMRSSAVSVLGEDFVTGARARGLPERVVQRRYVGRNARLPLVTGFAISLGFVVSGSVLIEQVFVYPGVGQLLANALARRDYTVMQGIVIVTTVAVLVATTVADSLYSWLDPRIRSVVGGAA